jgi:hypothetical protein
VGGWVAAVTCSQRAVAAAPVTLVCKATLRLGAVSRRYHT